MTIYQIEIQARRAEYDVRAAQLAREILHLPPGRLPSLAVPSLETQPLSISTAQLYYLSGNLTSTQIEQLTQQLLADPVVQQADIHVISADKTQNVRPTSARVVDVYFHPGVTDTLAESVMMGAQMIGITGLEKVETGRRYNLDSRLNENEARTIAESLLYNPVIQHYTLHSVGTDISPVGTDLSRPSVNLIPLSNMNDQQLLEVSRAGLLSLNLDEMRTIQRYYREQGCEPTDVELETLAQTWSEHCSHKTFKATIDYQEVDDNGQVIERETIASLLKQYIMKATEELKPSWLVSAFSDNAGIIRFTESQDIAFKVETHNHPSAIEPFGGANTGVGGVIRDVLGVSAQPVACTDILCFGPPDTPIDALPAGILSPRRIASGVVNGVRDYGNKMGIPTVNGAILYHTGYLYNPLVFCGCLGMLPHGSHPSEVQAGDLIVVLGGRTGRDGIHGATFSSGEMSSEINAQAGAAVQIGAPITEKKVTDVIVQARDQQLYHAITDCGAGGFSSAIGEMGARTGARVELANAPLKYQGLAPWEIWLSEAQERMVLAVPPKHLDALLALCAIEEVEASILGTFTSDQRLVVTYQNQVVADIDMNFLHDGGPKKQLAATWNSVKFPPEIKGEAEISDLAGASPATTLLALLGQPTIASKEAVVRRYDHEVQGATVLKPLVGRAGNGPGDAAVLQPVLAEGTTAGIVLSNGINPLYGRVDPYEMAINAVDEALRNLTAVGGDVEHAAILDNFCWGNPNDEAQLGMLVRAVKGCYTAALGFGTPFISGKDSLNNEYRADGERLPVIPTLLISAVGVIKDAAQTVDMSLKANGNKLYLLGETRNELAGSHFEEIYYGQQLQKMYIPGRPQWSPLHAKTSLPRVNIPVALSLMKALGTAIRGGLVQSCHDLSEGGLAVAAAEMCLAGMLGMDIQLDSLKIALPDEQSSLDRSIILLFSETPSRFLVEVAPGQQDAFETYMRTHAVDSFACIGTVSETDHLVIRDADALLVDLPVERLQIAWKGEEA